jgi:hypothetical protein
MLVGEMLGGEHVGTCHSTCHTAAPELQLSVSACVMLCSLATCFAISLLRTLMTSGLSDQELHLYLLLLLLPYHACAAVAVAPRVCV